MLFGPIVDQIAKARGPDADQDPSFGGDDSPCGAPLSCPSADLAEKRPVLLAGRNQQGVPRHQFRGGIARAGASPAYRKGIGRCPEGWCRAGRQAAGLGDYVRTAAHSIGGRRGDVDPCRQIEPGHAVDGARGHVAGRDARGRPELARSHAIGARPRGAASANDRPELHQRCRGPAQQLRPLPSRPSRRVAARHGASKAGLRAGRSLPDGDDGSQRNRMAAQSRSHGGLSRLRREGRQRL